MGGIRYPRGSGAQTGQTSFVSERCDAAALWGHYTIFGANSHETSISDVVGTGNGGGIILDGNVVKGKNGFGGELGHVLIPYQSIAGIGRHSPAMQLRKNRRPGVAMFAHRHRENTATVFSAALPEPRVGAQDRHQAAKSVSRIGGPSRCHVQRNFSGASPRARAVFSMK